MAEAVEVKGLRELRDAMLALPKKMDRRILNSALMAGARLVVNSAKARVPVDSGELRRNIRARPDKPTPGNTATVIVGVRKLTKKQLFNARKRRPNASDPFYWRFVEFGTSKMRARPFLRPGFESQKNAALDVIRTKLIDRVEEEARKLRR